MRILIKEVGPIKKEAKYYWFELTYESDGKEQKPKKIMSFVDAYNTLKGAKEGEQYDVKLTKDDNGYWQWENVTLVDKNSAPASKSASFGEDRSKLIIRQSSLAQAVAFYAVWPHEDRAELNEQQVLDTAANFEAWVNRE